MGIRSDGSSQEAVAFGSDHHEGGATGGIEERPGHGGIPDKFLADRHVRSKGLGVLSHAAEAAPGRLDASSCCVGQAVVGPADVDDHQFRFCGTGQVTGELERSLGPGRVNPHHNASLGVVIKADHRYWARGRGGQLQADGSYEKPEESPDSAAAKHQHAGIAGHPPEMACGQAVQEAALDLDTGRYGPCLSFPLLKDGLGLMLKSTACDAFDRS